MALRGLEGPAEARRLDLRVGGYKEQLKSVLAPVSPGPEQGAWGTVFISLFQMERLRPQGSHSHLLSDPRVSHPSPRSPLD